MKLEHKNYIDIRCGDAHIDLNGIWDFCWLDADTDTPQNNLYNHSAQLPNSIYNCLVDANILPNPYYGVNSKEFYWVDEKVWYFKKTFNLNNPDFDGNACLCFDGVSYYTRLWVNTNLIGEHEGMFGGPCVDIAKYLNLTGKNEIIIEIKAANYGKKEGYEFWNKKGTNREIIPWNIVHDNDTSNGDFIVMGIWNNVRLEMLSKMHISRPYLVTEKIDGDTAHLKLELQIADGTLDEFARFEGYDGDELTISNPFYTGITQKVRNDCVDIEVIFKDGGNIVYKETENVSLTDYKGLLMLEGALEIQFYQKDIEIKNPKLWYPNGLGNPHLYDVEINLYYKGKKHDSQSFKYGIRTFTADYTKSKKYRTKWNKFLYSVNGRQIFLKGINWTPIDFLFSIDENRYKWCLSLIKNAGIQLIRVWNGGGFPESDTFYRLCDEMGIMVWQDAYIANTCDTHSWPQDILEVQTAYNIFRIRNHPSLVIHCGGNEHIPYAIGNSANMYVTSRTIKDLDPSRIFYDVTPDGGSVHMYRSMEPVWYRHIYKLPFLAESGVHSFPNFITLKKYLDKKETTGVLPDILSDEFKNSYPTLLNHFTEYIPLAILRMTSRISQICDMTNITLEQLCEASQVQSYEFYQLMIQAMLENYPLCGGIMPWVFKRSWPTCAIQTVDGDDRPGYAYYAIQNSYRPLNVCFCQKWSVLAPMEPVELTVKVFNHNNEDLTDCDVTITVFDKNLNTSVKHSVKYDGRCEYNFGTFIPDKSYTNTCFLISCEVSRNGKILARSVYFNKVTDLLADEKTYSEYRNEPNGNLHFKNGPWLKEAICKAPKAKICAQIFNSGTNEYGYDFCDIHIKNTADTPCYPVTIGLCDENQKWYLSENFFMLMPNEEKQVRITANEGKCENIYIRSWNADEIYVNI